ncbi:MAG: hypothetical protein V9E94_01720 [Microthrixaceae bacterium]
MPPEGAVVEVLQALRTAGPVALTELESMVNLRRGRLEALLKVLDVEGAVTRDGSSWSLSDLPWAYDSERYAQLAEARARPSRPRCVSYQEHTGCRLRFLREQLDDVEAVDCGRCDNCTGTRIETAVDAAAAAEALAFVRSAPVVLDPRKQWPRGLEGRSGNIPPDLRAEEGRALAFASDPGWSEELAERFALRDSAPDEDLLRAVAAALKAWPWGRRPTWVTWVPSRTRPELVRGLARRLADVGRMEIVDAVRRTRQDAPPQAADGQLLQPGGQRVGRVRVRPGRRRGPARGSVPAHRRHLSLGVDRHGGRRGVAQRGCRTCVALRPLAPALSSSESELLSAR